MPSKDTILEYLPVVIGYAVGSYAYKALKSRRYRINAEKLVQDFAEQTAA